MKLSLFFGVAASMFVVASASAKPAVDVEALERRGNLDDETNYLPQAKKRMPAAVDVEALERRGNLDDETNYLPQAKKRMPAAIDVEGLERRGNLDDETNYLPQAKKRMPAAEVNAKGPAARRAVPRVRAAA